jgi:hypothetical protein
MEHFPGDLASPTLCERFEGLGFAAAGGAQYDHVGVGGFAGFPIKLIAEVDSWAGGGLWRGLAFWRF